MVTRQAALCYRTVLLRRRPCVRNRILTICNFSTLLMLIANSTIVASMSESSKLKSVFTCLAANNARGLSVKVISCFPSSLFSY